MLTLTPLIKFPNIRKGDDLADVILKALRDTRITLQDRDILVLAQKIVSKAEGRTVNLNSITPSSRAKELAKEIERDPRLLELILQESNEVLRFRLGTIIVEHKLGFVCANAGIDHSNVNPPGRSQGSESYKYINHEDWVLLLPKDPDHSAWQIRDKIERATTTRIGVLIIDSHGRAWREGTVGISIGLSGLPALEDLRGTPDMFGFKLRITQVGVADELAAAASLMMGQAAEGTPVIHVRGFPYQLRDGKFSELLRSKEKDMFR